MALDPAPIFDALLSRAMTLNVFEQVAGHPVKVSPGYGLICDVELADPAMTTVKSGLASTTVRIEFAYTVYTSADQEPADAIEPQVLTAVGKLWEALIGGFTLGGLVRCIDVLGSDGERMRARPGYATVAGVKVYAMVILVPVIVDDVFPQVP